MRLDVVAQRDDQRDVEEVEHGEMPLESYTLIHGDAKLSAAQTEALINWAKAARLNYSASVQPQ